jgi:hypothetical protein
MPSCMLRRSSGKAAYGGALLKANRPGNTATKAADHTDACNNPAGAAGRPGEGLTRLILFLTVKQGSAVNASVVAAHVGVCQCLRNDRARRPHVVRCGMPQIAKKKLKSRSNKLEPVATVELVPIATAGHGYADGSKISHPMFGDGTVTAVDGDKLLIKFKDGRVKLIVAAFVKPR